MNTRLKRIIGVMLGILIVSVLCTAGVWAYIGNDVSNDASNGVIALKLGNTTQQDALNVPNASPGDSGQYSYHLENSGNISGSLSVNITNITNTAGTTGKYADGSGDLGRNTEVAFYLDSYGSGDWSQGDIGLSANGQTYPYQSALQYDILDNYAKAEWNGITTLSPGNKLNLVALWRIPSSVGNEIQGDSVSYDISFTLTQVH